MKKIALRRLLVIVTILAPCLGTSNMQGRTRVQSSFGRWLAEKPLDIHTGKELILGDKRMVLLFWASWCQACKDDLLHGELPESKMPFVAVSIDKKLSDAKRTVTHLGLKMPLYHDQDRQLVEIFNIEALPVVVLLERQRDTWYILKKEARLKNLLTRVRK